MTTQTPATPHLTRITDPAAVGSLIAGLRSMCLLSQRQLCAEIDMHQARLSDWETGRAVPTLPYLIPALKALGFDLALIPSEDNEPSTIERTPS